MGNGSRFRTTLSLHVAEMLASSPADGVQTDGLQDALEKLREQMNPKAV